VCSSRPVSTSTPLSVLSREAETARRPSALTATPLTAIGVALQGAESRPLSQIPHLLAFCHPKRRPHAAIRLTATPVTKSSGLPGCGVPVRFPHSHTFSVLSHEAETATPPSTLTATPVTELEWPLRVLSSRRFPHPTPSAFCHPKARPHAAHPHSPQGIDKTRRRCSVRSSRPVSTSHTSAFCQRSGDARRPSAPAATPLTELEWPLRVRSSRPVSTSHTFSVLSSEAETASRPFRTHRHAIDKTRVPSSVRSSARFPHPTPQRAVI